MTREWGHEPVGFGGAFARQFRLLWTSRRPLLLGIALLALLVLAGEPWVQEPTMRLLVFWPVWLVFVGPVWGFAVFHNEGPGSRLYFWSHPTGRFRHTMARIAAGAAWLWVMFAALILVGWLMGLVDGDAWQMSEIGAIGWVNLFTGPLIGYLAISLLTVPSDYPIRWFFGIIFLFPFLGSLFVSWLKLDDFARTLLEPLNNEDWGLAVTLLAGLGNEVVGLQQAIHDVQGPAGDTPFGSPDLWWVATPLWILLLAGLVAALASRHPDTLPRLRDLRR
ncbi:MAG: hypothetical protein ACOC5I_02625 [Gemmatimonadota bacterium]